MTRVPNIAKYSVFIYSEAEPQAMYDIYKQTRTLCVLQYEHLNNWNECFRCD